VSDERKCEDCGDPVADPGDPAERWCWACIDKGFSFVSPQAYEEQEPEDEP
jgi:hypothetical protein